MRPLRTNVFFALLAISFVLGLGIKTFSNSDVAKAGIVISPNAAAPSYRMPTARDLTIYERRLRKASRDNRYADSCGRGQLLGNAEVHVAMHFPPEGSPATAEAPGFARAHVSKESGTPKALVLESKYPTVWTVTGAPSVIVLTGKAVLAEYPEDTPVFAPRFAEACGDASWASLPKTWTLPLGQSVMNSMVDDVKGRFDARAHHVSQKLFGREAAGWEARLGDAVIAF